MTFYIRNFFKRDYIFDEDFVDFSAEEMYKSAKKFLKKEGFGKSGFSLISIDIKPAPFVKQKSKKEYVRHIELYVQFDLQNNKISKYKFIRNYRTVIEDCVNSYIRKSSKNTIPCINEITGG